MRRVVVLIQYDHVRVHADDVWLLAGGHFVLQGHPEAYRVVFLMISSVPISADKTPLREAEHRESSTERLTIPFQCREINA